MTEWLKYFFGNFFNKKYADQSANRSYGNCLLAFLLAMFLLLVTFSSATTIAFPSHYNKSGEFHAYYHGLFDGDNALSLSLNGGVMSASIGDNAADTVQINTYTSDVDRRMYSDGKYNLIVDTRDITNLYNDCTVEFVNTKNADDVLTYEEYKALSSTDAGNYSATLKMSENAIEFTAEKIADYADFVAANGDEKAKASLAKLKQNDVVPAEKYADMYKLYYSTKYGGFGTSFSRAPTMRNYYILTYLASDGKGGSRYENYVIILRDIAFFDWRTNDGLLVSVTGYYNGDGMQIDGKNIENADKLVTSLYKANTNAVWINYFLNIGRTALLLAICWVIIAIVVNVVGFVVKSDVLGGFGRQFKTIGGFWLGALIPSVVFIVIAAFFMSQTNTFYIGMGLMLATVAVRSIVHYAAVLIEEHKQKLAGEIDEQSSDGAEE